MSWEIVDSLFSVCGPFTPYVGLVGKLLSACIINHHVRSCQLLVVEPDYLPDSEVLAFNRVYTP